MKTKYFLYGGQVPALAYRWKGYTLPGLTRVASDTRGLSGLGRDPEMEYLPYRASGPEPLDPGESASGALHGIDDPKTFAMVALAGAAAWWLLKRRKR